MKKKWKIIFSLAAAAAAAAVVLFQTLQTAEVNVQKVRYKEVIRSFTEEGTAKPLQDFTVHSIYAGRVEKLLVKEGQEVGSGELLAVICDRELMYELERIDAALESAAEEQRLADENFRLEEKNYQRIENLYRKNLVAEIDLDEAGIRLKKARASMAAAASGRKSLSSQRSAVKYRIDNHRIYSPLSGTVIRLLAEEKGLASPEIPMMKIFADHGLKVETRVLTRDVHDLEKGMEVKLVLEKRDRDIEFKGTIAEIYSYAEASVSPLGLEEERVKVVVFPEVPKDLILFPGYRLDVEFITRVIDEAVAVPRAAVFTHEGNDTVFVVQRNRIKTQKVETGMETRREVVIESGLSEGDLVVRNPQTDSLDKGKRVTPVIIE